MNPDVSSVGEGRKAYDAFGVFIMPCVLVVNAQGEVTQGFGYSAYLREKIETEILVLEGKIT